jgi:hypothetical protein
MKIFFAFAPELAAATTAFHAGVENQARLLGFKAVYASDAPAEGALTWLVDQLSDCQFAIFDVSTRHPNVMIALGAASEGDVQCVAMQDPDVSARRVAVDWVVNTRQYFGAEDFQRKFRRAVEDVTGVSATNQRQLIEHIKGKLKANGSLPMRSIAREIGRRPDEIRWLVYSLVERSELAKDNYGRWSTYRLPS